MKLHSLTLTEAREGLKSKKFSSVELTKDVLQRIKDVDDKVKAFVTVNEEEAIKHAEKADAELKNGADLPLLGIPVSVKDNFSTKGLRTTASSKVLDDYIPPFDATVVARLKNAGAIIVGKTNLDAWAHGSSTETSDYGTTRNPWNTNHLPGGSSGGAAASIAADETIFGVGSETAGSIRQPADWCGIVGMKPTYGRVSRYGIVAMASSLDSPGPMTKSVEDAAYVLQLLAGQDPFDATTSPRPVENYLEHINKDIKNLKIGISDEYFEGVNEQVQAKVMDAIKVLENLGAKIEKISLFAPKYAIAVYTILQRAEVSSNLARYDGIRFGNNRTFFGDEAKRRIMLGTYALSAGYYDQYYNKAQKVRTVIVNDFKKAYEKVDLIVAPTNPTTALEVGETLKYPMYGEVADRLVEPSSIAGLPGINVPVGFSDVGLPIGMQIFGPQFSESLIFNVANLYEKATDVHKERPNL